MKGIFYIDKPKDMTSRDVVNIVSKKINIKKVGHTGTLDPMATGVLIVCAGKATKIVEDLTSLDKEYEAEITLGIKTDTGDITGEVTRRDETIINESDVIKAINSFPKKYLQEVPIYSAVKVNGKKLYEYAREGIQIELPKREVTINSLEVTSKLKDGKFKIKTSVSKGTYIRALIEDLASSMNTVGTMSSLRRTKQGSITIDECTSLEDISIKDIRPIKDVLDIKQIIVDDTIKQKVIYGQRIENIYNDNEILLINNEEAIAIYMIDPKDSNLMKPKKVFI